MCVFIQYIHITCLCTTFCHNIYSQTQEHNVLNFLMLHSCDVFRGDHWVLGEKIDVFFKRQDYFSHSRTQHSVVIGNSLCRAEASRAFRYPSQHIFGYLPSSVCVQALRSVQPMNGASDILKRHNLMENFLFMALTIFLFPGPEQSLSLWSRKCVRYPCWLLIL